MDREPSTTEPVALPFELRRSVGARVAFGLIALMAFGFSLLAVPVAMGWGGVHAQSRVTAAILAGVGWASVFVLQVRRLVLYEDRIERIAFLGTRRQLLPLSSLRSYRLSGHDGGPHFLLMDADGGIAASISARHYEQPELLGEYLAARVPFESIEEQLQRVAVTAAAHGEPMHDAAHAAKIAARLRDGVAFVFVVATLANQLHEPSRQLRDGLVLGLLLFLGAATYGRIRHRRLSVVREINEALVIAQLFPSLFMLVVARRFLPELADAGKAMLVIGIAALPIAAWEVAINAERGRSLRGRLLSYGFSLVLIGPWLLEANVRFATAAPFEFPATVTAVHCASSRGSFDWRAPTLGLEGTEDVRLVECLRLKVGQSIAGHRVRGLFGLSVVRVEP